jgi:hypothetical protein
MSTVLGVPLTHDVLKRYGGKSPRIGGAIALHDAGADVALPSPQWANGKAMFTSYTCALRESRPFHGLFESVVACWPGGLSTVDIRWRLRRLDFLRSPSTTAALAYGFSPALVAVNGFLYAS